MRYTFQDKTIFHTWFAWYPVYRVETRQWIWLEYISRKETTTTAGRGWDYIDG